VTIHGVQDGRARSLVYSLIDSFDKNANISAMMRTTAYPTSVIAQFIVNGVITQRGVTTPEQCVPLEPLLRELRQRNFDIREEWKD